MSKVILFDLPTKGTPVSWSPNPWKTRMALNYKGIPYTTQWIEYPDLAPNFKKWGIPPNPTGSLYTSPTVQFLDDNSYAMDSKNIAIELERRFPHPSPPLHLDSPYVPRVYGAVGTISEGLRSVWQPRVPTELLNERSKEYFERTREETLGVSLSELARRTEPQEAWARAKPGFHEVARMLKEHPEGPFIMGKEFSYADIIFVSLLHFYSRLGNDIFEEALGLDESIRDLYEASKAWLAKDD